MLHNKVIIMSKFETHLTVGIILGVIYALIKIFFYHATIINWLDLTIGLLGIPLFSILSDIDQTNSRPRKIFLSTGFLGIIALSFLKHYLAIILICLIFLFVTNTKHRGFLHSIPFGIIISAPFIFYNYIFTAFVFLSYLSHIILDKTTKQNDFPY